MAKRSGLPKYCYKKQGGSGIPHYYYQRGDFRVPLPPPDGDNFWDEYNAAEGRLPTTGIRTKAAVLTNLASEEAEMRAAFRNIEKGAKQRAKKAGRDYTLPIGWMFDAIVSQKGRCELSGVHLRRSSGRFDPLAPSIDRINPKLGYTPDNCHVVALGVNISKRDLPVDSFIALCRAVVAKHGKTERERIGNLERDFSSHESNLTKTVT